MAKYLSPCFDLVFKKIFGEHPELTRSFLNAVLPLGQDQVIESLEYLSPEQVPDNAEKRNSIVDVRCKDNYGRFFIVEMQSQWATGFFKRVVYNASKTLVRQLNVGDDYQLLKPVFALAIVNDVFDHRTDRFYHHYEIVNCENTDEKIGVMEYVFLEIPKFRPESVSDRRMMVLWMRFMRDASIGLEIADDLRADPAINEALRLCEESGYNDAEMDAYDREMDALRTYKTAIRDAVDEGMEKGIEQGKAEGIKQGKAEEKAEMAIAMYKNNEPADKIALYTGLSQREVETIIEKL